MAKLKMTNEERIEYLSQCEEAIQHLHHIVSTTLAIFDEGTYTEGEAYDVRAALLSDKDLIFKRSLSVIQRPDQTSEYSEEHLKMWRQQVRRLDIIVGW